VERTTYQAYGATESDYRPSRWDSFREDYKFTGKEEDIEIGLQYFEKRYYSPALNRFVSADPLAVSTIGRGDMNVYAYVHGRALYDTDPDGLEGERKKKGSQKKSSKNRKSKGSGGKKGGYPPEDAIMGTVEHIIIGHMYMARNPHRKVLLDKSIREIVSEYGLAMPKGSRSYAKDRPDIVDAGLRTGWTSSVGIDSATAELVEIKPRGSARKALKEVKAYKWMLEQSGISASLRPSDAAGMKGHVKLALFEVTWWSPDDGVIEYSFSLRFPFEAFYKQPVAERLPQEALNRNAVPETEPAAVPQGTPGVEPYAVGAMGTWKAASAMSGSFSGTIKSVGLWEAAGIGLSRLAGSLPTPVLFFETEEMRRQRTGESQLQ
jgi:RHS repeat-associated protein